MSVSPMFLKMKQSIENSGLEALAPAGYYVALRVGFAYPLAEVNAFPEHWVERYTAEGLMLVDPVMRWVYAHDGAVRWADIAFDDPRGVLAAAAAAGLRYGVAVVCRDSGPGGARSFGSFARADRDFTEAEIDTLGARLRALHDSSEPPGTLTEAELEALRLVRDGLLLKEIADSLGISEGAVKARLLNAKRKLKARNSTRAAALAMQFGLI